MSKKKNTKIKNNINVPNTISPVRIILILIVSIILMLALIVRLTSLQIIQGAHLQTLATSQQTLTETLTAKRGNIYDSTGEALAISYYTDKVYINKKEIADGYLETIIQDLANILVLDYTELFNKVNSSNSRVLIAEDVVQEKTNELKTWKSEKEKIKINDKEKLKTGISFEESSSRYYPKHTLASTVIGFVGTDNQGLSGIESSCDTLLSGTSGKSVSLKDASQSQIANSEESYIAAENGYDINLTIDVNIQNIVEKYLAEAVSEYKCESGITIAMDPSTGKILAMADYPNYDCNSPNTPNSHLLETWETLSSEDKTNSLFRMWAPKAVTDTYEPGSVFKIITSSIALEENIVDTDVANTFKCVGSYLIQGEDTPIKCHKYPDSHGSQSLRNALENSCNPAFIELGLKIGSEISYKYYEAFGFFNKTGFTISGEPTSGIFYPLNEIRQHELGTLSFGQRFNITPLQMITAAAAIANDGILVQPQVIDKMTNTDTGEITTFKTEEIRQVISKETADKVASMMESVVTDGTGSKAQVAGYSIGGKTGTSEPIYGTTDGYTASFLAISPVENTKIVLLVILDSPGEGVNHNGGQIAAPTASKMLAEILPYMGVESGNNETNNSNISEQDLY